MNPITQSDLNALAALANTNLLPIVNNPSNSDWQYFGSVYDKFTGGNLQVTSSGTFVTPQPYYAFTVQNYANIIPAGSHYDVSGNFVQAIATADNYNLQLGANDTGMTAFGFNYDFSTNFVYMTATNVTLTGTPGAPVTATLTRSPSNWLYELGRIRGDLMTAFLSVEAWSGASSLAQNPAAVCSGPWCIGVIDPVQFPKGNEVDAPTPIGPSDGFVLGGLLLADCTAFGISIPVYKSVQFVFKHSDLPAGFTGNCGCLINNQFWCPTTGAALTPNITYTAQSAGTWNCRLYFPFNPTSSGALPPASAFTITVTPNYGWTWTTVGSGGNYYLVGTLTGYAVAAGTATIDFSITAPAGYQFATEGSTGGTNYNFVNFISDFILASANTLTNQNAVSPTSYGQSLAIPDIPANSTFTLTSTGPVTQPNPTFTATWRFQITPAISGVWVAKTLPCPGQNVFIDQDIPPYVGAIQTMSNYRGVTVDVAVAGNGMTDGSPGNPKASTMRQTSPISFNSLTSTWNFLNNGIQSLSPGISCRPAKWLVRRDTDLVPFDLGFNALYGNAAGNSQNVILAAGQTANLSIPVTNLDTALLIRLVGPDPIPGWLGGAFQYGTVLGSTVDIYVSKTGYPNPANPATYDFHNATNQVTIPTDGGAGYLAAIVAAGGTLYFTLKNNNAGTVSLGCYTEIDTGTPSRIYTPPTGECFSYCLTDQAGVMVQYQTSSTPNSSCKPVPQSGYSIFKVRATRLPQPNASGVPVTPQSGSLITVTIGQNVLAGGVLTFTPFTAAGGGNLTVTIPANAGTSDDVDVFIPVLGGNEVVYQCTSQVIFEAWADWQPIWFDQQYAQGQFPFDTAYAPNIPGAMFHANAIFFVNQFNVALAGWPYPYPAHVDIPAIVNFPFGKFIYNDLITLLGLL